MLVRTQISAISPGTEMLIYRDQFPPDLPVDATLPGMDGRFAYPLTYGYASVGQVVAVGEGVDPAQIGDRVFAFQPHQAYFCATPASLLPVPDGLPGDVAALLPNMETAVNLVLDAAPRLGEKVVVLGQGIVGLLVTALLGRFPLESLTTVDGFPLRRGISTALGADQSLDPASPHWATLLAASATPPAPEDETADGADLILELSGNPAALDTAIAWAGFGGRIVIGSWYGQKRAEINLGGGFHRKRLRLLSSQVSTIDPTLAGRWTHPRRLALAWELLESLSATHDLASLITHRFPIGQAAAAYRLIDKQAEEAVQVVFEY